MNVADWIDRVTQSLRRAGLSYGHGTACPEDEAAWLVLHAVGIPAETGPGAGGIETDALQAERIETLLAARIERRVPLAYLIGRAWFAGLEFEVDPRVLVPRSPIAELIVEQFEPWLRPRGARSVLDLCTGCGCIAIATAVYMPGVHVDAADISEDALAVAARNVARHGVGDRVKLWRSDLFAALGERRYDLIVTNPPYVPDDAARRLPPEFLAEPGLGLFSGREGLDACLRILRESPLHLEDQGILVCEVGESQEQLESLLPAVPFLWLEFTRGGSGVFVLDRGELVRAGADIARAIEEMKHV